MPASPDRINHSAIPLAAVMNSTDVLTGLQGSRSKNFSKSLLQAWIKDGLVSADLTDSSVAGRAILAAVSAAAQRTLLGLDTLQLTHTTVVANAAARLALSAAASLNAVVVDADTGDSWMLVQDGDPAVEADWIQIGDRELTRGDLPAEFSAHTTSLTAPLFPMESDTWTKSDSGVTYTFFDGVWMTRYPAPAYDLDHASSHATGGSDPLTPAAIGAATAAQGTDERVPTAVGLAAKINAAAPIAVLADDDRFGGTDTSEEGILGYITGTVLWALILSKLESIAIDLKVKNYTESVVSIGTVGASHTLVLTNGCRQRARLTASTACTFTMPTPTDGKSFSLELEQAAVTGNGSATFTDVDWGATPAPTITVTAGKMDMLTFVANGSKWYGSFSKGYTY